MAIKMVLKNKNGADDEYDNISDNDEDALTLHLSVSINLKY